MVRTVKDAGVRRKELLDTALALFESVGYERTSIEQITGAVGVAKGTFYHYFDSKQDLLEQLVTDWAELNFANIEKELGRMEGGALARVRGLFTMGGEFKLERRDTSEAFGRSLYSDENLRLRHVLMAKWAVRMQSILTPIIAEGVEEGVFRVGEPSGTAAALTSLWFGWSEQQAERALALLSDPAGLKELITEVRAVETAMERILGLTEGTLMLGLDRLLVEFSEGR